MGWLCKKWYILLSCLTFHCNGQKVFFKPWNDLRVLMFLLDLCLLPATWYNFHRLVRSFIIQIVGVWEFHERVCRVLRQRVHSIKKSTLRSYGYQENLLNVRKNNQWKMQNMNLYRTCVSFSFPKGIFTSRNLRICWLGY